MYKLLRDGYILRLADGAVIPTDPMNLDYVEFQTWCAAGNTPEPVDMPSLADQIAASVTAIDVDVDAIYYAVIGNRQAEYDLAESDASTFKAAGYPADAPASVHAWAVAKNWSDQQACDSILATAGAWRQAQASIRAQRLQSKEDMRNAADGAALNTAIATWQTFRSAIRAQLGL
jgi:hypothetical protein